MPHTKLSRRQFITHSLTAAGALAIGPVFNLGASPAQASLYSSAWLEIRRDNTIVFTLDKAEMGQNVITSLTLLVAEEARIHPNLLVVDVPTLNSPQTNPLYEPSWATVASASIRSLWNPLREAGALSAALFREAASAQKGWRPADLSVQDAFVLNNSSGEKISYADLLDTAAQLSAPGYELKKPDAFVFIGKQWPRLDLEAKASGKAVYSMDAGPKNSLQAVLARSPIIGARPEKLGNREAILGLPGVRHVVTLEHAVAVIADNFWLASQAVKQLQVEWSSSTQSEISQATIQQALSSAFQAQGFVAQDRGSAKVDSENTVTATYTVPYLAHAPLEPMNCCAWLHDGKLELWTSTQRPQGVVEIAQQISQLPISKVILHQLPLGGGFGRRLEVEVVAEAVTLAMQTKHPVKVIWTREDDIQQGPFRPPAVSRFHALLDDAGFPKHWYNQIAVTDTPPVQSSPSGIKARVMTILREVKNWFEGNANFDSFGVDGAVNLSYSIPNFKVESYYVEKLFPTGAWRSVGFSYNNFFVESFIDELANSRSMDPLSYRLQLLQDHPRFAAVLQKVAEMSSWREKRAAGSALGIACSNGFGSFTAQVAEIEINDKKISVKQIWSAVDCGILIDPDGAQAQIEGGILFGLSAALDSEISFAGGRVQQSNFHDYKVLRMDAAPDIEVAFLPSAKYPGGLGEVGTPPIAPAVANAVFHARKIRLRHLPLRL